MHSQSQEKELSALLMGIKKANLSIRNFPSTTVALARKLNVTDGGEVYLFATTLADERKVLIRCSKL